MKKQIIMATISFYSFTCAMERQQEAVEREPEAKVFFENFQKEQQNKQQPDALQRCINAHQPQSLEDSQNIPNKSVPNQSPLFIIHRTNHSAKL